MYGIWRDTGGMWRRVEMRSAQLRCHHFLASFRFLSDKITDALPWLNLIYTYINSYHNLNLS
jgi:hypothetical protein